MEEKESEKLWEFLNKHKCEKTIENISKVKNMFTDNNYDICEYCTKILKRKFI